MTRILTGQCRCRAVTYEAADEFAYAVNCHCSNCRRTTGSAFKPLAGIAIEKIKIAAGSENLMVYGDEPDNYLHCGKCGSLLYAVVKNGTYAHVTMGTLVDTPSIRPTHHVFVGSKAEWFEITDDLPQYDESD
ncbi:GFA family protein [Rhizobium sp. P38BS-XIX]|uniref:GFA family protein n=1 Tax=Rhizobium sp. P38BS-XIX TaxID=2726740 RepID=UPI001457949B|nr:GFA family protein [Rhizobium sp. P38BS-XIX]NLR97791.1 GFA family protein [Rhizobium sp. P38BS-XIX]